MKGKRTACSMGQDRPRKNQRGRKKGGSREAHVLLRILTFGAFLALLIGGRTLFPDAAAHLTCAVRGLTGQGMDFREAFAAVGRAAGGGSSVSRSLQEAYTAVFQPSSGMEAEEAQDRVEEGNDDASADAKEKAEILHAGKTVDAPVGDTVDLPAAEEKPASETLAYLYDFTNMPENASLEQAILGFSYVSPVQGRLTSAFGWREHPVSGASSFHYGIDLAAESGTEIVAFADGTVYASGESTTLGKYLMISHEGGYRTLYAHCSEIMRASGAVSAGETVAKVGDTGVSTGPHLHFELHRGDLYLNPIYYVKIWQD